MAIESISCQVGGTFQMLAAPADNEDEEDEGSDME